MPHCDQPKQILHTLWCCNSYNLEVLGVRSYPENSYATLVPLEALQAIKIINYTSDFKKQH